TSGDGQASVSKLVLATLDAVAATPPPVLMPPVVAAEAANGRSRVGAELLESLEAMTEGYRHLDRELGAAAVFDDINHHLYRITTLKGRSMSTADRRRLVSHAG